MPSGLDRYRRPRDASRYVLAVVLAFVVQALMVGALLLFSRIPFGQTPAKTEPVTGRPVALRPMSAEQWAKNRAPASDGSKPIARRDAPVPLREKKKPEAIPEGQVVATAPGNDKVDPAAKYLSESSNTVEKETRAREQTSRYQNPMPQRTAKSKREGAGEGDSEKRAGNEGDGADDRKKTDAPRRELLEVPDVEAREEVAMRESATGQGLKVANRTESDKVKGNSSRLRVQEGEPGGADEAGSRGRTGVGMVNLMPSAAVLDQIAGAAPNDHLRDLEEGEGTFLNTREWKYAGFFNRVKQSIGQNWNPGEQLHARDPSGEIYGGRDRYTVVNVTLDERGLIKDLYVEKSSGVDFLDREAVRSFERAQPFPNPPPGLLKDDATVKFSFGFFLEMSSGGMKLFRRAN